MTERATERDGEHVTAIKSDETGRWVRIPDGVDGVRAYQLLRAASTDAPTEERGVLEALRDLWSEAEGCPTCCNTEAVDHAFDVLQHNLHRLDRAPTDEAPERGDDLDALVRRLYADGRDDRLATGSLYLSAADAIQRLRLRQPEPAREGEGERDG